MNKKFLWALIMVHIAVTHCYGQENIVYQFDQCVNDSLKKGVNKYSVLFQKPASDLKLFILLVESNGEYELYLQEYSHLPKSGFQKIISTSNRKIQLSNRKLISILYPSDILTKQLRKDKIAFLPYSGYYLKVVTENGKQKVVQVADLL